MENIELILVTDFCKSYEISYTFITGLRDAGLVEVVAEQEQEYIRAEQLSQLEKLVRLHNELDINPEGVEAIAHLLQRMDEMQQRIRLLQQRLSLYEANTPAQGIDNDFA